MARAAGARVFPARFQLVATMNLCPCGARGDPGAECSCSPQRVAAFRDKLSRALLDRFDLVVTVPRPRATELAARGGEASEPVRARVVAARGRPSASRTKDADELLSRAVDRLPLSAAAVHALPASRGRSRRSPGRTPSSRNTLRRRWRTDRREGAHDSRAVFERRRPRLLRAPSPLAAICVPSTRALTIRRERLYRHDGWRPARSMTSALRAGPASSIVGARACSHLRLPGGATARSRAGGRRSRRRQRPRAGGSTARRTAAPSKRAA